MADLRLGKATSCDTRSLLVLDNFRGHLTEGARERLRASGADLAIIPGGMTGTLQPRCFRDRPFKCGFLRAYTEWMATTVHQKTPTGLLKKASLVEVWDQILEACGAVFFNIVEKSFKVTGIFNKLDMARKMTSSGTETPRRVPKMSALLRTSEKDFARVSMQYR